LLGQLRAKAYDPVINGVELASGSIRIHRRDVQRLIFKALGMSEEEARSRFGFFLTRSNTARRRMVGLRRALIASSWCSQARTTFAT
jgi:hypothetical protein